MRKWFLCFHPGNGCISTAAAAVYHYASVARALIFVYCLYVRAQSLLRHQPFPPRFTWFAVCWKGGLKNEQSSSDRFWDFFFFFFFAKGQNFFFWKTQTWCDFLVQTARINKAGYLIITPRIHIVTQRMSLLAVNLLKLGLIWNVLPPRDPVCHEGGCGPTTHVGSLVALVRVAVPPCWNEV